MKKWAIVLGLLFFLSERAGGVVFLDSDRTLVFTMRTYTQARLLTDSPQKFRKEYYNVGAFSLLQHRTYLEPQLRHDLYQRTDSISLLKFLKDKLAIDNLRYFIGIRIEYDGIYDYGPDLYRKRLPSSVSDELKYKGRLFEVYGDLRLFRRLYLRVGKQNISWGETDVFRLLDQINPLDQTFGGFLTALDERRVPSFMIKGLLDLGRVGPFYSLSLEGFIEPEPELTKGPTLPAGAPWSIITGPPVPFEFRMPEKEAWEDSRFGFRFIGNFSDYTFSVAHYWTYWEIPVPYIRFDKEIFNPVIEAIPQTEPAINEAYPSGVPYIELGYPRIMISGASLSGPIPFSPYSIFRLEFSYIYDTPIFVPAEAMSLLRPVIELPDEKLNDYPAQLATLLQQLALLQTGAEGKITKRDAIRWCLGVDHNQWIRFLNPRQTFFISFQFFGEHYLELPKDASFSVQYKVETREVLVPGHGTQILKKPYFVPMDANSYKLTFLVKTGYPLFVGYLFPQISLVMEFGNFNSLAYLIQPSLTYYYDPFRFIIEYNYLNGDYKGIGFLKDRDNLMFKIEYLL